MNFKLKERDYKFWDYVRPKDAQILLGYCYGRYHFLSYHSQNINIDVQYKILIYKDLLYALVLNHSISTYKSDIVKLIDEIINLLFTNLENNLIEDDIAVIQITELSALIGKMKFHELEDKFLNLLEKYIIYLLEKNTTEENIFELKFHYNVYSKEKKYKIQLEEIDDPLLEILIKKEGVAIVEMIKDILENILEKVKSNKRKESPLFLDRTVFFREIGSGFIWSGYIEIAKNTDCKIKLPLPKIFDLFSKK